MTEITSKHKLVVHKGDNAFYDYLWFQKVDYEWELIVMLTDNELKALNILEKHYMKMIEDFKEQN